MRYLITNSEGNVLAEEPTFHEIMSRYDALRKESLEPIVLVIDREDKDK